MKVKNCVYLLITLILLHASCVINPRNYTQEKDIKKYSNSYQVFLGMNKINTSHTFLDKENIEKIEVNKKAKRVTIFQKKRHISLIYTQLI